jgi:hypothetical protein
MRIVINIRGGHVLVILLLIIAFSATGLVLAYGGSSPAVMGHTWGEMICDSNLCVSSGRIGVGNTSPNNKLTVGPNNEFAVADSGDIIITGGSDSTWGLFGNGDLGIMGANANSGIVSFGGNVGIGTANPGKRLDVSGFTRTSGMDLSFVNPALGFNRNIETGAIYNSQRAYQIGISGDDFYFAKYSSSGAGEGVPIFIQGSTGNVGIGTSNPAAVRLDVNGDARVAGAGGAGSMYLGNRGFYIRDDGVGDDIQTNAKNMYVFDGIYRRLLREGDYPLIRQPCTIRSASHPAGAACQNDEQLTGGSCKCDNPGFVTSGGYPSGNSFYCNGFCSTGSWDFSQAATSYAICCLRV